MVQLQGNIPVRKSKWGADRRGGTIHGGTYMPVTGSYRTLTQCSSNVQIGWDLDGIYHEYWCWIFVFLSGLLIVHYFGFEGGTHSK